MESDTGTPVNTNEDQERETLLKGSCSTLDENLCLARTDCEMAETDCASCSAYGCTPCPKQCQERKPLTCSALDEKACLTRTDCEMAETRCASCSAYGCTPCPKQCQEKKPLTCWGLSEKACLARKDCQLGTPMQCTTGNGKPCEIKECMPRDLSCKNLNAENCDRPGCQVKETDCRTTNSIPGTTTCNTVCEEKPLQCGDLDQKACQARIECEWGLSDCETYCGNGWCKTECMKQSCKTRELGTMKVCDPQLYQSCGSSLICAMTSDDSFSFCTSNASGLIVGRGYTCGSIGGTMMSCAKGLSCKGAPQKVGGVCE